MYKKYNFCFKIPVIRIHYVVNTAKYDIWGIFIMNWNSMIFKSPKYIILSSSVVMLGEFIHMLALFSFSTMEHVCLPIGHISCQYTSVSVIAATQVTPSVADDRSDSASRCIVICKTTYQRFVARGMCVVSVYTVFSAFGHSVLGPHWSDSWTWACLDIYQ